MATDARVPTSDGPSRGGWSLETAIDYLLAVIGEKHEHTRTLIAGNDKRYEERFAASQKALELGLAGQKSEISAALAAADRAVQKAETATERRFEGVNEFRGALDSQQRTLITRSEVDVTVKGLEEKIGSITKIIDGLQADYREQLSERKGVVGGWGYAVGAAGLIIALASFGLRLAGK